MVWQRIQDYSIRLSTKDGAAILRFLVNGVGATLVHYACLYGLMDYARLSSAGLANGLAAMVGITASYLGNRVFVFRSNASIRRTLPLFLVIYAAIALIHGLFLWAWADHAGRNYTTGFIIATAISTVFSYLANRLIVFRSG